MSGPRKLYMKVTGVSGLLTRHLADCKSSFARGPNGGRLNRPIGSALAMTKARSCRLRAL